MSEVLREPRHESLAVAILLFMILLPGKHPFSYQGGGDPAENMRTGHFPYCLGAGRHSDRVPSQEYRNMWSNLPRYLKNLFTWVFDKSESRRFTTDDWIWFLERYLYDIDHNHVSHEICPSGNKQLSRYATFKQGGEWVTCDVCHGEYGRLPGSRRGCPICRDVYTQQQCFLCNRTFRESCQSAARRGEKEPVCLDCRKNTPTQRCVDCGQTFDITAGLRVAMKRRGYQLPKRCSNCRKARAA
jgi:hypothetical protein